MTVATAIVKAADTALAQGDQFFSPEQEKILLSTFLGGASKEEAQVLLATVQRRRLDPFSRQVFFVKRYDLQKREEVWAIQTSIDGLRSIADRTGRYEGQTKPEWCGKDGKWLDVWLAAEPPAAARVGVYKTGFREPAYGIARFVTYVQTKRDGSPTQFWVKMPDLMLAKCAEALALRKAFPEDTGGLYVAEEMGNDAASEIHAAQVAQPLPSQPKPFAKLAEPVVVRDPEPEHEVKARTAHLVAAAEALGGTIVPPHTDAQSKRSKAIWIRAKGFMSPTAFAELVVKTLGSKIPSTEWSDEQMAQLETAVAAEDDIKF